MKSVQRRFIELLLVTVGIAWSFPALADYVFATIDEPSSTDTQVFGVNNSGQVVGDGVAPTTAPFVYDSNDGTHIHGFIATKK